MSMTAPGRTLPPPAHPLAMLTADEVRAARAALAAAGHLGEDVRFAWLDLAEPAKSDLLAFTPGGQVDRRLRALLLDRGTGTCHDVLVSVTRGVVERVEKIDTAVAGQPPIMEEEFEAVQRILDADESWRAALARRGLPPESVRAVPLSAGHFGHPEEVGRRVVRSFGFHQRHERDHPWAHPIGGLVAYVDLIAGTVTKVIDDEVTPVPAESGDFDDPAYTGPARTTLKPIAISQPDGVSFTVEDGVVRWENWTLRLGFNVREGLTLHQITFHDRDHDGDRGREREVVHRASIAEMVVPYADPSPLRYWQNYFDQGEYLFGRFTNSLDLGCDCLGEIHYTDVVVAGGDGEPRTVPRAICLHEEDHGVLWKHTDLFTGSRETRRQRRLVISFFTTVGNYDYGFYWYLYLDGTIGFECKATGILFAAALPDGDREPEYATEVAPGLGAPYHQHLFSARLDMAVDGHRNAVEEVDAVPVPVSDANPYGNAFSRRVTRLTREREAGRVADTGRDRTWRIINPERTNRLGRPVGYTLVPEGRPALLADPTSSIAARAAFATRHLWVTRHADDERYPAGDLVNQHPGGAGLPAWTAADRDIDGTDIVVWHTFGLTHFPRPEDWPVMPVDTTGFTLKPTGFFDRNPALDVPRSH
ncbi:primary-amine oxidase [Nonomuraea sp. NN258]|uniref:primary-amine oxidase n=1 Tax=Nonomuraea antri TaxID=2730852 RepID=UPI0015689991|nr:primary-amine oxidase [Nonomuraea antri]NRQ37060.1 primary-amine oxidase [Nonomuraea antri]